VQGGRLADNLAGKNARRIIMKKKGFTLVELLVVIAIIALLISILVPSLNRAREITKRTMCLTNLAGIGKAYLIYQNDNDDKFPMYPNNTTGGWFCYKTNMGATTGQEESTGIKLYKPTSTPGINGNCHGITALMFALVRKPYETSAGMFVCLSDNASPDTATKDPNTGLYYWDFSKPTNVSYSHQMVNYNKPFKFPRQFLLADKNPDWNTGMTTAPSKWQGLKLSNAANLTVDQVRLFNSQNHSSGEMQNVLMGDGSTAKPAQADVGLLARDNTNSYPKDNIFTAYDATPGPPGPTPNCQDSQRTGTGTSTTTWKDHWIDSLDNQNDAFLIGPWPANFTPNNLKI
jgi:prepilin-type N-terminal cleavage/methylation domain-containing protein